MTYEEKLKDPQWLERRDEIKARDKYTCVMCHGRGPKYQLEVHHVLYLQHRDPWNYPDEYLVTLCSTCHREKHFPNRGPDEPSAAFCHFLYLTPLMLEMARKKRTEFDLAKTLFESLFCWMSQETVIRRSEVAMIQKFMEIMRTHAAEEDKRLTDRFRTKEERLEIDSR